MFWADFHIHSNYSDGKHTISELVDLYGQRGFGAIAITDHLCESTTALGRAANLFGLTLRRDNFDAYLAEISEQAERAWAEYEMVVISGFELTKNSLSNQRSAHVLALDVSQYIDAEADVVTLTQLIREQGGLAIAAHPVSTRKFEKQTYHLWDRREELRECFDAWEVASGPHLFDEVLSSGLPLIANSDLHASSQMSSWKTILRCERSVGAILKAIKRQELSFRFYQDRRPDTLCWEQDVMSRTGFDKNLTCLSS